MRGERVEDDELQWVAGLPGPAYTVAKVSIGAVRGRRIGPRAELGLGGLYALNFVPGPLAGSYGSGAPQGFMAFISLKIE
jgi:hypothetical protein